MSVIKPEAAVAIVRAKEPQESILLIRRTERADDSWSGHWSFPGGRHEPSDPDLLFTALRELEEECGIQVPRECEDVALPPVLARRKTGPFVLVAPFVFSVDAELLTAVNPAEAVEAVWVPLSVWRDPVRHSLRTMPGQPDNWLFPSIELNKVPVWGFTYRLAMDWLGLLPQQSDEQHAGFEIACRILEFLASEGLTLNEGWAAIPPAGESQRAIVKASVVNGRIPVQTVLDHFSSPGLFPTLNLLEVRPDRIRVVGLAFEEYLILSRG